MHRVRGQGKVDSDESTRVLRKESKKENNRHHGPSRATGSKGGRKGYREAERSIERQKAASAAYAECVERQSSRVQRKPKGRYRGRKKVGVVKWV